MSIDRYIFNDATSAKELERLRLLESVFDPSTHQLFQAASPLLGRSVLEVGAGAGSIARWLGEQVGADGLVTAVDIDTRFLQDLGSNVSVVSGHLDEVSIPDSAFHAAHTRYVLIHNTNPRNLLERMLQALRPGGFLILEEPDFSAARALVGPRQLAEAFSGFTAAFDALFQQRGMDYSMGQQLPSLVQESGAALQHVEYDSAIAPGGSPLAEMMCRSTEALAEKYLATGCVSEADLANYKSFTDSDQCWGIYYATVRVIAARK